MLKVLQAFTPTISQAWMLLSVAIALEVAGTTCMKLSQGFTRPVPSVAMFGFMRSLSPVTLWRSKRWI